MKDNRRFKEMLIGTIAMYAIVLFFIMIAIAMITSCGIRFRLPDRSKCVIPWSERKDCIDDTQCEFDEVCAHRGRAVGKCTLLDCCYPWRNGPVFLNEADWCDHTEAPLTTDQR